MIQRGIMSKMMEDSVPEGCRPHDMSIQLLGWAPVPKRCKTRGDRQSFSFSDMITLLNIAVKTTHFKWSPFPNQKLCNQSPSKTLIEKLSRVGPG